MITFLQPEVTNEQRNRKERERMGKVEISISKLDGRSFLKVGQEQIEISDYTIKSSADGSTELSVVIKGTASIVDFSASITTVSLLKRLRASVEECLRHPPD